MSRLPANPEQAAQKIVREMTPFILGTREQRQMARLFGAHPSFQKEEYNQAEDAGAGNAYRSLGIIKNRIKAHLIRTRNLAKLAKAASGARSVAVRQKRVAQLAAAVNKLPDSGNPLEGQFNRIIQGRGSQGELRELRKSEDIYNDAAAAVQMGDYDPETISELPSVQAWYEEILDVLSQVRSLKAAYDGLHNMDANAGVRARLGSIAKRQLQVNPRCGPGTIGVVVDRNGVEVAPTKLADAVLMDLQGNYVLKEGYEMQCKRGLPLGRAGFSFNTMVVPFKASSARKRCRGSACSVAGNRKSSCRSEYYKTRDVAIVPLPSKTKGGIRLAVKRIYANGKAHVIRHNKKYIAVPSSATIVRNIAKVCTASAKARISAAKKAIRAKHSAVRKAARAAARKQKRKAAAKAKKAKKAKKPKKKAAPKAKKAKKPKKKAASKKKKKPSASASASGPRRSSRARKAPKRFSAPSFYLF